MTDFLLYSSIRDYIYARIIFFTEHVLSETLMLSLTIILSLLTLWVMVQGFLIATGRSQESLRTFIFSLGKAYIILLTALGTAGGGTFGVRTMTETLSDGISQIMTGDTEVGRKCLLQDTQTILGCKIDQNLSITQTVMNTLAGVDTADDDYLESKLTEARWFAGIGTAGPAIVAGGMLIMFRVGMALFIGFAPLFILCLLSKKTAPLFQKWLNYGLATIFSGVLLGVMSDISMDLVGNIAASSAVVDIASMVMNDSAATGIMQTVTQQLGLGLLLSMMLITVPPMAGQFFNGVMAGFSPYSVFDRWNNSGGTDIRPPHMGGGRDSVSYNNYNQQKDLQAGQGHIDHVNSTRIHTPNQPTEPTDTIRINPQFGNAKSGISQDASDTIKSAKQGEQV